MQSFAFYLLSPCGGPYNGALRNQSPSHLSPLPPSPPRDIKKYRIVIPCLVRFLSLCSRAGTFHRLPSLPLFLPPRPFRRFFTLNFLIFAVAMMREEASRWCVSRWLFGAIEGVSPGEGGANSTVRDCSASMSSRRGTRSDHTLVRYPRESSFCLFAFRGGHSIFGPLFWPAREFSRNLFVLSRRACPPNGDNDTWRRKNSPVI